MKKTVCLILALLMVLSCLTACNFTQNISGALASKSEAASKVEEMMTALAENRASDAEALMHPQVAEKSDDAIDQMVTYLAGRKTTSVEMKSIYVNNSIGTSGKAKKEETTYSVTLTDGDVVYLSVVYLSDNAGTGFSSFQLVLGVV